MVTSTRYKESAEKGYQVIMKYTTQERPGSNWDFAAEVWWTRKYLTKTRSNPTKGVSVLVPDSIHIDFTLRSTSYGTRSIHFDRVRTMNTTAQGLLFVHVIGHAFFNKSIRSVEILFWLLLYLLLCFRERKANDKIVWRRNAWSQGEQEGDRSS